MDRLQDTLTEFGHGMAFVGRQVRFDVDDSEVVLDLLRRPERHAPTVGTLLCTEAPKNEAVRYVLTSSAAPLAVAGYTYDRLPAEERAALPDVDTLTAALSRPSGT